MAMEHLQKIYSHTKTAGIFWQLFIRFGSVKGFISPMEGFTLFVISQIGSGLGEIVEIGSYRGLSTCWLAASIEGTKNRIYAVDHFEGSDEHSIEEKENIYKDFIRNISDQGLQNYISIMKCSSEEAERIWSINGARAIRLLFIDGDHSYGGIKKDFDLWSKYVCPGGMICFHDYGSIGYPGITRFVDELLASSSDYGDLMQVDILKVVQKKEITRRLD